MYILGNLANGCGVYVENCFLYPHYLSLIGAQKDIDPRTGKKVGKIGIIRCVGGYRIIFFTHRPLRKVKGVKLTVSPAKNCQKQNRNSLGTEGHSINK